ncbi:MAG: cache domain-containing protein, partial [Lachnospiraceae bacterium]|nr:cache domain-containing protein [Lachnospiraceae bacterium]
MSEERGKNVATEETEDITVEKAVDEKDASAIIEEKHSGGGTKPDKKKKENRKPVLKRPKRTIKNILIDMSVVPLLVLGVILTVSTTRILKSNIESEITKSLDIAANSLYNTYSLIAPGDYRSDGSRIYKGDLLLTGSYEIVDALKAAYDLDVTLYYGDTIVLTTIMDENGRRIVGTQAGDKEKDWVLNKSHEFFGKDLKLGNDKYYGYFVPMVSRDGAVVGMAFAGKHSSEVKAVINNAITKAVLIFVTATIVTLLVCITANRHITSALHS